MLPPARGAGPAGPRLCLGADIEGTVRSSLAFLEFRRFVMIDIHHPHSLDERIMMPSDDANPLKINKRASGRLKDLADLDNLP